MKLQSVRFKTPIVLHSTSEFSRIYQFLKFHGVDLVESSKFLKSVTERLKYDEETNPLCIMITGQRSAEFGIYEDHQDENALDSSSITEP